jgi:protein-S-isoprenylcysteine O-methyltransferase Ste14
VHHLAYSDDVAAGQLAVFQGGPSRTGGSEAPISGFIRVDPAILSWHWLPFLVLGGWLCFFIANMRRKDRSLARYPGFAAYKARTGMFLPSIAGNSRSNSIGRGTEADFS